MPQPKIIIVSDGTPDGSKVYLNGQEVSCDGLYFNFSRSRKEGEYENRGFLNLEVNKVTIDESGTTISVTYRLSPPVEVPVTKGSILTFKREIKDGKSR